MFLYNPITGRLTWKSCRATNVIPGDEAGCEFNSGTKRYRVVNIGKRLHLAHRLIWSLVNGSIEDADIIDHIDGDGLNNRIANLRLVSKRTNALNGGARRDNTSGVRGVTFDRSRMKWAAFGTDMGRRVHLGRFVTIEEARDARANWDRQQVP
jgi:hypothetical protein